MKGRRRWQRRAGWSLYVFICSCSFLLLVPVLLSCSFSLVFHFFWFVSSYIYVFCSLYGSFCCVLLHSFVSLVFFPVLPLFLPLYFLSSSLSLSLFSPLFFCLSFLSFASVLYLLRRDGCYYYGWCMLTVRKGSEDWCLRGLSVRLCFSGFGQKKWGLAKRWNGYQRGKGEERS